MQRRTFALATALALAWTGSALAHVTSNMSCTNCHDPSTGRQSVNSALVTSAATDPGVIAGLKKFQVVRGQTASLKLNILNGSSQYAGVLADWASATTDTGALNAADTLTFTPDATWTARTSGGFFATKGPNTWSSSTTLTYNMAVNLSTPPDYYLMTFKTTGLDSGMWTQSESFYLQVLDVPEPAALSLASLSLIALRRRR